MSTSQASLLNIPHCMIVALSFPKGQGSPSSTQIIMSNCELDRTYIIQSDQQFKQGANTMMRQLSVMVRPSNHNNLSLGISWTIFWQFSQHNSYGCWSFSGGFVVKVPSMFSTKSQRRSFSGQAGCIAIYSSFMGMCLVQVALCLP